MPNLHQEMRKLILPLLEVLHVVALRLTHSNFQAEVVVAETLVRVCERFSSLRDHPIFGIISNIYLSGDARGKFMVLCFEQIDNTHPLLEITSCQ
jgi:hypothetical protein